MIWLEKQERRLRREIKIGGNMWIIQNYRDKRYSDLFPRGYEKSYMFLRMICE